MTLTTGPAEPIRPWNAYLDWAARLEAAEGPRGDGSPEGDPWHPVFVVARDPAMTPEAFFAAAEADPRIRFEPMERALNGPGARPVGAPVEATLYLSATVALTRDWFDVLHVGAATRLAPKPPAVDPDDEATAPGAETILGIVDDGLPFLNARFRNGTGTRLRGLWLQSLAAALPDGSGLRLGRRLSTSGIDALLARLPGTTERALYREINDTLFAPGLRRTVEQAASHGGHLLDLAGGAPPFPDPCCLDPDLLAEEAALRDVPILGVQLPPQSIDDTSGVRMESHVVQGLRWMILAARRAGARRLVVNMSLGVVAGPKDGSRFIEQQIAHEIAKAALPAPKAEPLAVEVVLPFGNDYENRLVAEIETSAGTSSAIGLRVQRQDTTPSYVEIRPQPGNGVDTSALEIGLSAPGGAALAPVTIPEGQSRAVLDDGVEIARLYHVAARPALHGRDARPAWLALALAPTAPLPRRSGHGSGMQSPAGLWTLTLAGGTAQPCKVNLLVQRDDQAAGYVTGGKQAWLDAPDAYRWNPRWRDYSGLDPAGPVRHDGTNNAFATRTGNGVTSVGAARIHPGPGEGAASPIPAPYTSQGADWTLSGPEISTDAEVSPILAGRRASGTTSGSSERFEGTSVAAALLTRSKVVTSGRSYEVAVPAGLQPRLGSKVRAARPKAPRHGSS